MCQSLECKVSKLLSYFFPHLQAYYFTLDLLS